MALYAGATNHDQLTKKGFRGFCEFVSRCFFSAAKQYVRIKSTQLFFLIDTIITKCHFWSEALQTQSRNFQTLPWNSVSN